jgi:hypothetical protein
VETPISKNKAFGPSIASQKLVFQFQFVYQLPDRARESRALRPGLKQETIFSKSGDQTSDSPLSFEKHGTNSQLSEAIGTPEPGYSSANHYNLFDVSSYPATSIQLPGAVARAPGPSPK